MIEWENEGENLIGVDEVGRGPLAGDVVACASWVNLRGKELSRFYEHCHNLGVTDSKKLSAKKRQTILQQLEIYLSLDQVICNGDAKVWVAGLGPREIEQYNILQASLEAMRMAVIGLMDENQILTPAQVLIDGNRCFDPIDEDVQLTPIVKGDSKSLLIALASIVAKEYRDQQMKRLDQEYPGYHFGKNAGYPTAEHLEAVRKLGITPVHRRTFKGVKEYVRPGM